MKSGALKRASLGAALIVTATLSPAFAHHSGAMFDNTKQITLHGTVKDYQWTNPHVHIFLLADAEKAGDPPVEWSIEATSPGNLTRMGWTKRTVHPGDKVTVVLSPLRDGEHGGGIRTLTLADGTVIGQDRASTYKPNLQ